MVLMIFLWQPLPPLEARSEATGITIKRKKIWLKQIWGKFEEKLPMLEKCKKKKFKRIKFTINKQQQFECLCLKPKNV